MNALMHVTDWLPTLCSIAGIEPKGNLPIDGYDQSSNLKTEVGNIYFPREGLIFYSCFLGAFLLGFLHQHMDVRY